MVPLEEPLHLTSLTEDLKCLLSSLGDSRYLLIYVLYPIIIVILVLPLLLPPRVVPSDSCLVDEDIPVSVVAIYEAEPFLNIEEFDSAIDLPHKQSLL